MAKIGDTVRYLNSVGGGKIVRIEGNLAYVDEDGFETPVLLKECVVVSSISDAKVVQEQPAVTSKPKEPTKEIKPEVELPVVETAEGEKLNVVLGFEPRNLLKLSEVEVDTYLVNDSNYYLYFTYSVGSDGNEWKVRYAGLIEPNFQILIDELNKENVNELERISVQLIAFKKDKDFKLKKPFNIEFKFDSTKLFRRHCFKADDYFESDVIAIHLLTDDKPMVAKTPSEMMPEVIESKKKVDSNKKRPVIKRNKSSVKNGDIIVVDLHIDELLDSKAGMSNADILNYQIDEFRKVMDRNIKNKGQKIVFIHGKGEGVLKNALLKELNHRYKGNDIQDASFREYGFGATQVTIK